MKNGYKDFLAWKNCKSGAEFIKKKDMEVIEKGPNQRQKAQQIPKSYSTNKNNISYFPRNQKQNPPQQVQKKISFQILSSDSIDVSCDFNIPTDLINIFREFNGRYKRDTKSWVLPYTNYQGVYMAIKNLSNPEYVLLPITLLAIDFLCQPAKLQTIKFVSSLESTSKKSVFTIDYTQDPFHSIAELPKKMLDTLYNFQKKGIEFGIQKSGRLLIADEMGVGKTIQATGISAIFKEDWPVLILTPSSLKFSWRDEVTNWLEEIVSRKEVQVFKTSKDNFKEGKKYYIMSYDLSTRIIEKVRDQNFSFIIADEAHYLKNKDSKRSKLLIPVMQRCKRLVLLTGTPILARPVEAYPLLTALRPDFFHNFKEFGMRYCDPQLRQYGYDWSGSSNSGELHYMLSKLMIRRLKKDVLSELPPKKRQKIEIQTDKKVLNQVRVLMTKSKVNLGDEQVLKDLEDVDEDNSKEASNSEINCFTKAYLLTGKAKIPGIKEYITYLIDNSCKFLIFAHHIEVLDAIEEEVKKTKVGYVRIDGQVKHEKKHERVAQFQNDEDCLVAILAITSCATGITLTKASTVVFAELYFTPAIMAQAEDRAHRIGQEHECVNVHYLIAADTVDEIIFAKLKEKQFVVSTTLDNKALDMGVEKVKDKVGDFVKGNYKEGSSYSDYVVSSGKDGTKIKNKTLNDFVQISKNVNFHSNPKKRERYEGKENSARKKSGEEDEIDFDKIFKI